MPKATSAAKAKSSNDALNVIGTIRNSGRTADARRSNGENPDNFHISYKTVRWSVRLAQIVIGMLAFGFYTGQSRTVIFDRGLYGAMLTTQVLTFIGLGMSLFAVAIYVVKFFGKWSSKKMLSIETGIDAFYTGFHLLMFILMTAKPCPAGSSAACDRFNWAISWTFFLVMSWGAALVTDVLSWRRSGGRGDRLVDFEQEVAMRRSRASRR